MARLYLDRMTAVIAAPGESRDPLQPGEAPMLVRPWRKPWILLPVVTLFACSTHVSTSQTRSYLECGINPSKPQPVQAPIDKRGGILVTGGHVLVIPRNSVGGNTVVQVTFSEIDGPRVGVEINAPGISKWNKKLMLLVDASRCAGPLDDGHYLIREGTTKKLETIVSGRRAATSTDETSRFMIAH